MCLYMKITSLLSSLSLESLECLYPNLVSATLSADFGTIVADVTLEVDADYYDVGESEFFVKSVKVQLAEDDNGEPMDRITYKVDKMERVVQSLLRDVMNRPYTSQDERELIKAIA